MSMAEKVRDSLLKNSWMHLFKYGAEIACASKLLALIILQNLDQVKYKLVDMLTYLLCISTNKGLCAQAFRQ